MLIPKKYNTEDISEITEPVKTTQGERYSQPEEST